MSVTGLHTPALRLSPTLLLASVVLVPATLFARPSAPGNAVQPKAARTTQVFNAAENIGPVYYPAHADANNPERKAAEELAHYLEKISGRKWDVLPEPASLSAHGIFVGRTRRAFTDGLWRADNPHAPVQLPTDRINQSVRPGRISIVGETPQATRAAVYRFLETHTGARWYAPGKIGEEIPAQTRLRLPRKHSHTEPSFRDRNFYAGAPYKDFREWAVKAGQSNHINISHNLHRTFTPELYQTHPEYWAQVGGKRTPPVTGGRSSQLDYTQPDVARLAAQAAQRAFDAIPARATFSLGINDTIDFGDDPATMETISPLRYWRGHPVYSDLIFAFSNDAARQVAQTHPDHYLTTLAYMWAEQLPSFPLEPNLMPYLAIDHAQWYDPERRLSDMELTRQWAHSGASELGTWEYYFGSGYFIPRIFNAITAESLKFQYDQGVRSLFMESGANAGFDAPKMWLATRLAWDIDADPAALLHDFYHGYYGAAGTTMQELFEYCERIWMEQTGESYWLKYFLNINQAALYPPQVLDTIDALLSRAHAELDAASAAPRYYERLQQTADNFAYLCAASEYYHLYAQLLTMPLDTAVQAEQFIALENTFAQAEEALKNAPQMQIANIWDMRPQLLQLRPEGRLATALLERPDLLKNTPAARPAGEQPTASQLLGLATGTQPTLLHAEAFAEEIIEGDSTGFAPQRSVVQQLPSGWNVRWTHHENASLLRQAQQEAQAVQTITDTAVPDATSNDGWQLTLRNQEFLSLFRWLPLPQDATAASTRIELKGTVDPGCQLRLSIGWLDAEHKTVGTGSYNILPPGDYTTWQDLAVAAERPEGAMWLYIGIRLQNQATAEDLHLRNWESFGWQTKAASD